MSASIAFWQALRDIAQNFYPEHATETETEKV